MVVTVTVGVGAVVTEAVIPKQEHAVEYSSKFMQFSAYWGMEFGLTVT